MQDLFINILSSRSLAHAREGEAVLRTLCNAAPELTPERYGNYEPLRAEFHPQRVEEVLPAWTPPFLWKRKKPSAQGSVWMTAGPRPQHAVISLAADSYGVATGHAVQLVCEWSMDTDADFGFVHLLTRADVEAGMKAGVVSPIDRAATRFTMFVTTHILRRYLPDLYWGTFFGPAYVRHFGKERLLDSPVPVVRDLGPEAVYVQMSHHMHDLAERYDEVAAVRERVKRHLGMDTFFNPGADVHHEYEVPELRVTTAGVSSSRLS